MEEISRIYRDKVRSRQDWPYLRRILAYGCKVLGWEEPLDAIRDSRCRPRIATGAIARAVAVI